MKARIGAIVLVILTGLLTGEAWADGKFYLVLDRVPPGIPYQRAFLLFDEGSETLIVQSKYELTQSARTDSLAWVVPVPSVPELASMDAEIAGQFFLTTSLMTSSRARQLSPYILVAVLVLLFGGVALTSVRSVTSPAPTPEHQTKSGLYRGLRNALLLILIVFLLIGTLMPSLSRSRGGLEIIKTEQVGIYDVTVIRGDSPEPVMAWLRENGFGFEEEDKAAFSEYVAQGWCFVTAKVNPNVGANEQRVTAEGMAAPLVLTFATDRPVYPLALTATTGAKTEILIYTLSSDKLACGGRLPLRRARQTDSEDVTRRLWVTTGPDEHAPMEGLPNKRMMLCKFKGTMTAAQMREDLVFEAATDNTAYRETKWVW